MNLDTMMKILNIVLCYKYKRTSAQSSATLSLGVCFVLTLAVTGVCCCCSRSVVGLRGSVLCGTCLLAERQSITAAAAQSFSGSGAVCFVLHV